LFSSTSLCSLRVFIFLQAFFILFRNLQLERERNLGAFRMLSTFSVCFGWFWNKSLCFDCFNRHFRFVSVCFGSFWNKYVCFGCFDIHFRFGTVHCETNLFVSVVSIDIRNTETNRNKIFNGFENEPKQTRNRSCFGYFRFEPKFFFFFSWTP